MTNEQLRIRTPKFPQMVSTVISAVFLMAGLSLISSCDSKAAMDKDSVQQSGVPEDSPIIAFGMVIAADRFEVHLPWAGRIAEIPVWVGKRVVRGDVLAVLDSDDQFIALEAGRLTVLSARGRLEEASSRLSSLEVSMTDAAERLDRIQRLVDGGSVSEQELSSLQAEYDALVHDRNASSWAYSVRKGEADQAEDEYERLIKRTSEPQLDENLLVCPVDRAVVAEILQRPGSEVETGTLVMVLHDTASLVVEADLPEEFVRDVNVGDAAVVIPVADPERSYAGIIIELAGLAKLVNGENVVKTRVSLESPDDFLREGFNVDVEIRPAD